MSKKYEEMSDDGFSPFDVHEQTLLLKQQILLLQEQNEMLHKNRQVSTPSTTVISPNTNTDSGRDYVVNKLKVLERKQEEDTKKMNEKMDESRKKVDEANRKSDEAKADEKKANKKADDTKKDMKKILDKCDELKKDFDSMVKVLEKTNIVKIVSGVITAGSLVGLLAHVVWAGTHLLVVANPITLAVLGCVAVLAGGVWAWQHFTDENKKKACFTKLNKSFKNLTGVELTTFNKTKLQEVVKEFNKKCEN